MTRTSLYGRQLGDFRILDCLDEGGFGSVYRCEQPLLGREAVVKVMHQRISSDPEAMRRFSSEARLAARLEHPYAAHVYAHGVEEDGLVWIAMELVHGVSLRQHLDDHGPIPLDQFVPLFERLAEVVHAAHEQGIVHRDLKPGNIMVNRGSPKLLDFGVAKLLGDTARETSVPVSRPRPHTDDSQPVTTRLPTDSLTPHDCVIGTPAYSSPEIWLGHSMGPPTDIYALGVIAFEALTGRRPFRAESYEEFRSAHLSGRIPSVGPMLPRGLDVVFQRALAKRPEDRYDTAIELAAALRGVLDGQRRRRSARRMGAWIGALVATLVFAGGVWRAQYERRLAEQRAAAALEVVHATALTAAVEQGRAALLAGDMQGAQQHLGQARAMGDQTWTTRFMFDRAMQPAKAELAKLQGHGRMWSASWSPDGRWIVTADDQSAELWDGDTYEKRATLPHGDTVYSAAWMGSDRVVTACGDGAVRVWDVQSGKLVRELRVEGKAPRWYVVAASGERVAAVDTMGAVAGLWETDHVVAEFQLHGNGWSSVAFSSDDRWLAVSGGDAVKIVDADLHISELPARRVQAIAWGPAGLATGSAAGELSIWDASKHTLVRRFREDGDPVDLVAFSPDGSRIAAGLRDGTELVFDGTSVSVSNHVHGRMMAFNISPDSRLLAAAASTGLVAISEIATGRQVALFDAPRSAARSVRFSQRSQRLLGATWDGVAWAWNAEAPYLRWSAPTLAESCGLIGGAEPDGRYLAVACIGHPTRVWDTANDRLLAELPPLNGGERVPYPIVSAGGDLAAIARGHAAEIYELPGGRLIRSIKHDAPVTALGFTTRGELISGDADGAVTTDARALADLDTSVDALAVLPDGRVIVADAHGRVHFDGHEINAGVRARMLRPSSDGQLLLVVPSYAGPVTPPALVDLVRGTVTHLTGPQVYSARWTPIGLLTAHADGAARIWDNDGALRRVLSGDRGFLADAAPADDGTVVGVGGDGALHFWSTDGQQVWKTQVGKNIGVNVGSWGIVARGAGGDMSRLVVSEYRKHLNALPFQLDMMPTCVTKHESCH